MKEKYSALIVEDEIPLQKAIKAKLERSGFNTLSATNVDQAIKYIKDKDIKIDAVWLDHYLLGDKNGLDFLAAIKKDKKYSKIPVFTVTNTGGHEKKQSYMNLGATKYYIKSDYSLENIVKDIKAAIA